MMHVERKTNTKQNHYKMTQLNRNQYKCILLSDKTASFCVVRFQVYLSEHISNLRGFPLCDSMSFKNLTKSVPPFPSNGWHCVPFSSSSAASSLRFAALLVGPKIYNPAMIIWASRNSFNAKPERASSISITNKRKGRGWSRNYLWF